MITCKHLRICRIFQLSTTGVHGNHNPRHPAQLTNSRIVERLTYFVVSPRRPFSHWPS